MFTANFSGTIYKYIDRSTINRTRIFYPECVIPEG